MANQALQQHLATVKQGSKKRPAPALVWPPFAFIWTALEESLKVPVHGIFKTFGIARAGMSRPCIKAVRNHVMKGSGVSQVIERAPWLRLGRG